MDSETRPRFEAVGRYVIDWEMRRISNSYGAEYARYLARGLNDGSRRIEQFEWDRKDGAEAPKPTKPDDCPEYYWAAGVQCMEVRNSIIESADFDKIVSSDWGHLFGYVFRMLRKGEPIKDLLKIEHFARIIRLRLEGKRK